LGTKIGKHLQLCWRAYYRGTRKNLESRTQLDEPVECASRGDPLLLYKILYLLFSPLVRILCALRLESRKNYQHGLDSEPLEFQFLRPRGCFTKPFRTLSLCFVVIHETPVLICRNNFVKKKNLSASAIAIISWQDVTGSSLCSGVKECGTTRAHNFLFPKSYFRIRRTTVLGKFKDSAITLEAIRRSFLTISGTAAVFTSVRVEFGQPPLSSSSTSSVPSWNREYHLKPLIGSEPHSYKTFAPIPVFLSQIDRLWNKVLWQLSVHFRHPWRIKKSDFTRKVITRTLSKINKRNSVCERMLVDST
jgi:hypothetical protein